MLRQPGYVYIAAAEGGLYKIGQSRNPEKRLKRFSDVPFGLQLLHQIETDDCRWLERRLHDQFWESRVSGEWTIEEADADHLQSSRPIIGFNFAKTGNLVFAKLNPIIGREL